LVAKEFLSYYDDDGTLVFNGNLHAQQGAVFLKAIKPIPGKLRVATTQQFRVFVSVFVFVFT